MWSKICFKKLDQKCVNLLKKKRKILLKLWPFSIVFRSSISYVTWLKTVFSVTLNNFKTIWNKLFFENSKKKKNQNIEWISKDSHILESCNVNKENTHGDSNYYFLYLFVAIEISPKLRSKSALKKIGTSDSSHIMGLALSALDGHNDESHTAPSGRFATCLRCAWLLFTLPTPRGAGDWAG